MKKVVWKFGLMSGAIAGGLMLISQPWENELRSGALLLGYATIVLACLLIFFGIRSYRDNVGGGHVGFGRALAIGTLIAVISSACYTATWEVIYFGFKTDFAEVYGAAQVKKLRDSGASQAQIDKTAAEMKRFAELYKNPAYNVAMTMIEPLPVGLVIALVSAGILSRRRRSGGTRLATA